jgi:HEPN domain-containing protein
MTPRLEAWLRQANDDLAMADHALAGGFHAQACYHASQADEAPQELFDRVDAEAALATARAVLRFVEGLA